MSKKTITVKKTLRKHEFTYERFTKVSDLVALVGEETVLRVYHNSLLYRKIGSEMDKAKDNNLPLPTHFDLTLAENHSTGDGARSAYGIEVKWLELVMKQVIAAGHFPKGTKIKDAMNGEKAEKLLTLARAAKAAYEASKPDLDSF